MCGRYGAYYTGSQLASRWQLVAPILEEYQPRYNVAPTDEMPLVWESGGEWRVEPMRWGLVPFWAKDLKIGSSLINARAETVREKPAFRDALVKRRCLVPASGFYEWIRLADGKQPLHIRRRDGEPFAFAGLWEEWRGPEGPVRSYTIITTAANQLMEPIHNRMPVILHEADERRWLDPRADPDALCALLRPCPDGDLEAFPVSRAVNRVGVDGPECLELVALRHTGAQTRLDL
jgi:putative SOS response-associated peptidase YedK